MYNSGYSHHKMGLAAKNLRRSKEKSCGYYMRIILFFSSLIQSLIIVSLVLFLIYGEPQHTVEEKRIQELEQGYNKLSLENVNLRAKEKNLTQQLNITLTGKKTAEKDLTNLRRLANTSTITINSLRAKWSQCELEKRPQVISPRMTCPYIGNEKYLEHRLQQSEELQKLLRANFTEQMHIMKIELETARVQRIKYQLDGIELRRDKNILEERLELYEKKCKKDFIQSLQGIPNVTKEFLKRVDDLFSKHISFQLTCDKQSIQLENIRANCSSLSTEVENKLQAYLDKVGGQVTNAAGENARCITENKRLKEDSDWCYRNRSNIIEENKKVLKHTQQDYDKEVEKLILDQAKQKKETKLLENVLSVKEIEIKMLSEKVKDLNISLTICKNGQLPGGASNPFMTQFGQNKFGSSRPGQGTLGAGSFGSAVGSSFGTGLGSAGQGTSLYGRISGGSVGSSGVGLGSTGSIGTGVTGLSSTGSGTAGMGSSNTAIGSIGSSGIGTGRTGFGSTGFGSTGTSGAGFASAGSSGTRTGMGGTGLGSTGSNPAGVPSVIGGRTTGDVLAAQINQHLRELHQYATG